jgi:hypothetical protein
MQVRDTEDWIQQRISKRAQSRLYPVTGGRGGGLLSVSFISLKRGPTVIDVPLIQHEREFLPVQLDILLNLGRPSSSKGMVA